MSKEANSKMNEVEKKVAQSAATFFRNSDGDIKMV